MNEKQTERMFMTVFSTPNPDGNCNRTHDPKGQHGVTIWGPRTTPITIGSHEWSERLYFTFTQPKCYQGPTNVCNVVYTISTDEDETTEGIYDVGPIWQAVNVVDSNGNDVDPIDGDPPYNLAAKNAAQTYQTQNTETHNLLVF